MQNYLVYVTLGSLLFYYFFFYPFQYFTSDPEIFMIIYSIPWDMRKLQMFRQHKSILKFWMFWAINQIRGSETHFLFLILHLLVPYLSFQSSNLLFYFPYNISKSCSINSYLVCLCVIRIYSIIRKSVPDRTIFQK